MKKIYLIGDSIRHGADGSPGYGICVKEKLEGKAEVFAPPENSRFAQYTLRYLHEWAELIDADQIDVVHWNNGLWDLLELFGDEPFTPLPFYVDTLEKVYKRIRFVFPHAKVIFANSTAVIEDMSDPDFTRHNSVIETYNQAAEVLMKKLGVPVNDLYTVSDALGRERHSDWVHYNQEGSELLADAVIGAIEKYAGL